MFQRLFPRIQSAALFVGRHFFSCFIVGLSLWLLIFGEHSVYHLLSYKHQQSALQSEISAYRDSIANYERQIQALTEGDDCLEQFAREHLLMKRESEDIFLVDED
jgi:cell division protein FtsB